MWQAQLHCPKCSELLYECDFQLEGELMLPDSKTPVQCGKCSWQGSFSDLKSEPARPVVAPPLDYQLDYQI